MAVIARANRYNFFVAFFVTLGSFTYGFNASISASVIGLPRFFEYFDIDPTTSTGNSIIGAINGVFLAGGAVGCWSLAWLADATGRVRAIQVVCVICIIAGAIQAGSVHVAMLLVGRLLSGLGTGLINCVIPLFQAEISPPSQRGRLVGAHGFILVAGYATAGWTGFGNYYASDLKLQWRLPLALQIVAPLLLLLGTPWLPESPRWLINGGRENEAFVILENLHRNKNDPEASGAHVEFNQIKQQLQVEAHEDKSFLGCFRRPTIRKRMIYGFCLQFLLQSTGVLVLFNYATILYGRLGASGGLVLAMLALHNTLASFYNWVNSMLLDRLGRKPIILTGLCGCIVVMTCYTALTAEYVGSTNKVGQGFAIFFMYAFAIFYGGCLDASSYVYCTEIFPTSVRAHGIGFSISGLFLANILYLQTAPLGIANAGWKYMLIFIFVPAVGIYPFWKFYPETKGLSLEEIAGKFGDEVAPISPPAEQDIKDLADNGKEAEVSHKEQPGNLGV